jgi:putative ABC transport system substrate-binding protein
MKRRDVLALLGGLTAAAVTPPWPATAQPASGTLRLGVLLYGTQETERQMDVVLRTLRGLGYIEGRNLIMQNRYANAQPERLAALAAEIVALKPDIVLVFGGDVAPFVYAATQTIPIVFCVSADPVRLGLVQTLARPGGNATGVTYLQDELAAKRVQIFKELVPRLSRMAVLWNPDHPDDELRQAERSARSIGIDVLPLEVRAVGALAGACRDAVAGRADALYVVSSRLTASNVSPLVEFARESKMPLVGGWGAWANAGALMSYGPNIAEMNSESIHYVSRIHKGAKPADLPVIRPTRFELLINMRTAKAMGIDITDTILARADEVIE